MVPPASRAAAPSIRRPLLLSEAQPWMAGAVVEVFWEAPPGSSPPTGWYTATVQAMSQRGKTQLLYEQSNAVETLDARDLQARCERTALCEHSCTRC